jgi:hypothetical protein
MDTSYLHDRSTYVMLMLVFEIVPSYFGDWPLVVMRIFSFCSSSFQADGGIVPYHIHSLSISFRNNPFDSISFK